MHHLLTGPIPFAFMALLVVALGCAAVAPMVDLMTPARRRIIVALWAALFLLAPAVWSGLDAYMGESRHSYLYELGHSWMVYTMFLSGLLFSWVKRWRRRLR